MITWWRTAEPKLAKNRLHLDIAPLADGDQQAEVDRLISLGARRIDIGQGDVDWAVMADPDDNEFCVLTPRLGFRSARPDLPIASTTAKGSSSTPGDRHTVCYCW